METFLLSVGLIMALLSIWGSIFPALPGPILSFFSVLFVYLTSSEKIISDKMLFLTGLITIIIVVVNNFIPIATAKMTGASKYGLIGSFLGMMTGFLLFPPIGIFFGVVLGAIIGELYIFNDLKKALNAGIGTIIGVITTLMIQIIFSSFIFIYLFIKILF